MEGASRVGAGRPVMARRRAGLLLRSRAAIAVEYLDEIRIVQLDGSRDVTVSRGHEGVESIGGLCQAAR